QGENPLKRHRNNNALTQDREIGDRHPGRLGDLGQRIRTTLRMEPGRKEMVEQHGKLARLLMVSLKLRTPTHLEPPLCACADGRWQDVPAQEPSHHARSDRHTSCTLSTRASLHALAPMTRRRRVLCVRDLR